MRHIKEMMHGYLSAVPLLLMAFENGSAADELTFGVQVNGTLSPTNETDISRFSGTAGSTYSMDTVAITGDIATVSWRLVDPYGNVIPGSNLDQRDVDGVTLCNSGTFTLFIGVHSVMLSITRILGQCETEANAG